MPAEVIAGVTLAALAVPEVMGYAKIAGMPVVTGLYTMLLPVVVFAVLGSSRHLVVGADSATAAILAAGIAGMAAKASPHYVALAGMLAILAGALLLLARIARLGFLADFLSRTMLVGFLTGVGIQVASGQVAGMLGVSGGGGHAVTELRDALRHIGATSATTVAVSLSVILVLVIGQRLAPKLPWAVLTVIGAIVASAALDLQAHGVATLGTIPSGLPSIGTPDIPLSDVPKLLGTAVSMFVVILAQSAATSRAYATKFGDSFHEDVDLVGLSFANVSAGMTGTFVVNGSPTKTEMVDSAGGRSQLAQLTSAAAVLAVLLFLTGPLSYLPTAALSAIVFLIALRLVDVLGMRRILRLRPFEFGVALTTALVVVFVGVEEGIVLAIALSVIIHLRHSYRPHDRLLVATPRGSWRTAQIEAAKQTLPGLVIYRFAASLYYANAGRFEEELTALADAARPPLRWLCVACDAMEDIDYSGSLTLRTVQDELSRRGVTLVLCGVPDQVRAELDRDGLTELIGAGHVFPWPDDVVEAYEREARSGAPA